MKLYSEPKDSNFCAQIVILAGGFGTRLSKVIGEDIPKPMALFNKKPFELKNPDYC